MERQLTKDQLANKLEALTDFLEAVKYRSKKKNRPDNYIFESIYGRYEVTSIKELKVLIEEVKRQLV